MSRDAVSFIGSLLVFLILCQKVSTATPRKRPWHEQSGAVDKFELGQKMPTKNIMTFSIIGTEYKRHRAGLTFHE
jgi:hypothetical protein